MATYIFHKSTPKKTSERKVKINIIVAVPDKHFRLGGAYGFCCNDSALQLYLEYSHRIFENKWIWLRFKETTKGGHSLLPLHQCYLKYGSEVLPSPVHDEVSINLKF